MPATVERTLPQAEWIGEWTSPFVKVDSLDRQREKFPLTAQVKQTFTGRLGWNPRETFARGEQTMGLRIGRFPTIRVLPRPEDGLRTLVERAPQAEAWADRIMAKFRPTLTLLFSIRRRLATGAVAVLTVWLFAHVMFGANGMVVYRQKKTEYQTLQKEIEGLQKENDRYTQQVKSLQAPDPNTIEKEAREQLHYARPGEVVYVAPPPPARPATQETNAARK